MSRGIRLGFGAPPLTLQASTGRYGLQAPPSGLASTGAQSFSISAGSGTYTYAGQFATLTNSGAGAGPSAVTNLQIAQQAGPSNTSANTQKLSWGAATAGANSIDHYKIYRNSGAYATTANASTFTYTDSAATNSSEITSYVTSTAYAYAVSAVDTTGVEGPLSYPNIYMYYQGNALAGGGDFSYGMTPVWNSTGQVKSPATQSVACTTAGGGFQPYTNSPLCPAYVLGCGAMNYYTFDMWAPSGLHDLTLALHSRPAGNANPFDVYSIYITNVILAQVGQGYGTFTPSTWCTFKVPIFPMGIGSGTFVGSVTSNNITCTSVTTGLGPDAGCYVTGGTIPTGTYIPDKNGNSGPIGTFPLTCGPGTTIPNQSSQTLSYQRLTLYKPDMKIYPTSGTITVYFDNFGFTTV